MMMGCARFTYTQIFRLCAVDLRFRGSTYSLVADVAATHRGDPLNFMMALMTVWLVCMFMRRHTARAVIPFECVVYTQRSTLRDLGARFIYVGRALRVLCGVVPGRSVGLPHIHIFEYICAWCALHGRRDVWCICPRLCARWRRWSW